MSVGYQAVGWNRQKRIYDTVLAVGVGVYLALFASVSLALYPAATVESVLIRGFGTGAWLLLHVVLVIGPLCRIDRRFLPLLYNRRHLGVTMFLLALLHGGLALFQFHALGALNPFVSVLVSDGSFTSGVAVPFQIFGVAALVILFLLAATSHDFWLANLSAPTWKALHMMVYVAYVSVVAHVMFGVVQSERGITTAVVTLAGAAVLIGLHLKAANLERVREGEAAPGKGGDWIDACVVEMIPEKRACVVRIAGERVAIFKFDGKVCAVSSVCQHQNGPLGEGRIIDGCITCPWHGYQYRPETGASPPPFTEKVPTFATQVRGGRVWVEARPRLAGTRVEPTQVA